MTKNNEGYSKETEEISIKVRRIFDKTFFSKKKTQKIIQFDQYFIANDNVTAFFTISIKVPYFINKSTEKV